MAPARCAISRVAALAVGRTRNVPNSRVTSHFHHLSGSAMSRETLRGAPRSFVTSRAFSSSASNLRLVGVIESEIEVAKRSDDRCWMGDFPEKFPFDIRDEPGTANIVLTRHYEGEKIEISASMPDLISGEEGEIADEDQVNDPTQLSVPLTVKLSKGSGPILEFHCTVFPDEISIDSMSVREDSDTKRLVVFDRMGYYELDERLQKGFRKYLEARGLLSVNVGFLHEYMINKDNREYLLWLKKLKFFIER